MSTPATLPPALPGTGVEQTPLLETPDIGSMAEKGSASKGPSWPWSMWVSMQRRDTADQAGGAAGVGVQQEMASRREAARTGIAEAGTSRALLPSSYHARWPSLWSRTMRWMRPLWDIYFVVSLVVLYALPDPGPQGPSVWVFLKQYRSAFIWIPFVYRFFTGFLHWVLALVIMPGSILYMPGPLVRWVPKSLQETINENNAARAKRRDELLAATRGTPIRLITPDGVQLDAVYWAGRGVTRDGPTVVRLNGNAEAFELQDDILPMMYCTRGINVLLFNYRGVGGSSWTPVCGSAALGHVLGMWSMPAAAGLQLDAWTAVQFLISHLQVPPEKVCVVGHSMGGAIAAKFLAGKRHLQMAMCSSRSFAYMSQIAGQLAPLFLGVEQASRKGRFLTRLTGGLVVLSGWQHRCLDDFHKIGGNKWLEFSTADHIISIDLSLAAAVRSCHMKTKLSSQQDEERGVCAELGHMQEGRGMLAGVKCVRLIGLDGMDNHNRLWMDEEISIHVQLVQEAINATGADSEAAAQESEAPIPRPYAV